MYRAINTKNEELKLNLRVDVRKESKTLAPQILKNELRSESTAGKSLNDPNYEKLNYEKLINIPNAPVIVL
jgi:hypothetical protein